MPDTHTYDAIVVGSGAAGGWAAKELTEKGLTVLLLEAGRSLIPEEDFPNPPPRERGLLSRAVPMLSGQYIQAQCAGFNEKTRRHFVNDRENPYTTPAGKPYNWFRGRQIGGRLHVWARVALRLSDDNFKAASRDGHGADWPISYGDLAPYYDTVETFLGLQGSADGLAALPDGKYAGPHDLNRHEQAFKTVIERRFPNRRVISARVIRHSRERIPLAIQAAQRTGRLEIRSDAVVSHVCVDPKTGQATGVCFIDRMTKKPKKFAPTRWFFVRARSNPCASCSTPGVRATRRDSAIPPAAWAITSWTCRSAALGGPLPDGDVQATGWRSAGSLRLWSGQRLLHSMG